MVAAYRQRHEKQRWLSWKLSFLWLAWSQTMHQRSWLQMPQKVCFTRAWSRTLPFFRKMLNLHVWSVQFQAGGEPLLVQTLYRVGYLLFDHRRCPRIHHISYYTQCMAYIAWSQNCTKYLILWITPESIELNQKITRLRLFYHTYETLISVRTHCFWKIERWKSRTHETKINITPLVHLLVEGRSN